MTKCTQRFASVLAITPEFAERILLVYADGPEAPSPLQDNAASTNPAVNDTTVELLGTPFLEKFLTAYPEVTPYDILLMDADNLYPVLPLLKKFLKPRGWLLWLTPVPLKETEPELRARFADAAFEPYLIWDARLSENGYALVRRKDTESSPESAFSCIALVPSNYDPLAHARELLLSGAPGLAFNLLTFVPEAYLANPSILAAVKAEQALCLLAWDQSLADGNMLARFHLAQAFFTQATAANATCHLAYCVQAEFWHRLGDDDFAARTLRSIQHVSPDRTVAEQLQVYIPRKNEQDHFSFPPAWNESRYRPKILFLTDNRPNYGLDVLYDGLYQLLGQTHVVEFPWKPTLHGEQPERFADYPCCFHHDGKHVSWEEILDLLRSKYFDLVVFGDIERTFEHSRTIVQEAGNIPLIICDMLDDFRDNRETVLEWLGVPCCTAYFKREMLACVSYGERVFPLPFAYPDERIPDQLPQDRPYLLFWAGQRQFGIRKLALEYLERRLGIDLSARYPQNEYVNILQSSRIGLDFSGFGFDTVRYWEVPAHGALLLAERRPTQIPYNFRQGESAVFFDDIPDLERKLVMCTRESEQTARIAQAGHAQLKQYHTASARARHFLGWVECVLGSYG